MIFPGSRHLSLLTGHLPIIPNGSRDEKALCGLFFTESLGSKLKPHLYFEIPNFKKKKKSKQGYLLYLIISSFSKT